MKRECVVCGSKFDEPEPKDSYDPDSEECEGLVCDTCELDSEKELSYCGKGCRSEYTRTMQDRDLAGPTSAYPFP
jgi:hypothetical protein